MDDTSKNPLDPNPANAHPGQPAPSAVPPAAKRRKKRWWLRITGGLLLLIILLLAFAPKIASTGTVRGFVLGKINEKLNGHLTVQDWSVSWTGGLSMDGLRLLDQDNKQILEVRRLSTQLSLIDAMRGRYNLGKTSAEGVDFDLINYKDGQTNFGRVMKAQASGTPATPSAPSAPKEKSTNDKSSKLPDVQVELTSDVRGTVESEAKEGEAPVPALHILSGKFSANIPNINQPINHSAEVQAQIGSEPGTGTISLAGDMGAVSENRVDLNKLSANEKLTIRGLDMKAIRPFLAKLPQARDLGGVTEGDFVLNYSGQNGVIEGTLVTNNLTAGPVVASKAAAGAGATTQPGGTQAGGETYATKQLKLTIPRTTVSAPAGLDDWRKVQFNVGKSAEEWITLAVDQGSVAVRGDGTVQELLNVLANAAPGANGRLQARSDIDLGQFSPSMQQALGVKQGVVVTSGHFHNDTDVKMTPEKAVVNENLKLEQVAARDSTGKAITISPINLTVAAQSLGGGQLIPDLRNLSIVLSSGFADARIEGESLNGIAGPVDIRLAEMQKELGQVIDFGKVQLQGTEHIDVKVAGDYVTHPDGKGQATVSLDVTSNNVQVKGLEALGDLEQKLLFTHAQVTLPRDRSGQVNDVSVVTWTDSKENPTLHLVFDAATVSWKSVPAPNPDPKAAQTKMAIAVNGADLQTLDANLAGLKQNFGRLLPSKLADLAMSGMVSMSGKFDYDGAKVTLGNLAVKTNAVSLGTSLKNYTSTIDLAGVASLGEAMEITLSKLNIQDNLGLLNAQKGDKDVVVSMGKTLKANGDLKISQGDLRQLVAVAGDFGVTVDLYVDGQKAQLTSGIFSGELNAAYGERGSNLGGHLDLSKLTIANAAGEKPFDNDNITVALSDVNLSNEKTVSFKEVALGGTLGTLSLSEGIIQLSTAEQAKGAKPAVSSFNAWAVKLNGKASKLDVGRLSMLAKAMTPPARTGGTQLSQAGTGGEIIGRPAGTGADPIGQPRLETDVPSASSTPTAKAVSEDKPLPPLEVSKGIIDTLVFSKTPSKSGSTMSISELTGHDFVLKRGPGVYTAQPFKIIAQAAVSAAFDPNKTLAEQIASLSVDKLDGNFGFANLGVIEPLVVTNPSGDMQAKGKLQVGAQIHPAMELLAVLQGRPTSQAMQYAGDFSSTQSLSTDAKSVHLVGQDTKIQNLVVPGEKGSESVREPLLTMSDDVALNSTDKSVIINRFAIDTQSKAIGLDVAGRVNHYDTSPTFLPLSDSAQFGVDGIKGMTVKTSYDAQKLLALLKPMFGENSALSTIVVQGVASEAWVVGGEYPMQKPFEEAIKGIKRARAARGGFAEASQRRNRGRPASADHCARQGRDPSPSIRHHPARRATRPRSVPAQQRHGGLGRRFPRPHPIQRRTHAPQGQADVQRPAQPGARRGIPVEADAHLRQRRRSIRPARN